MSDDAYLESFSNFLICLRIRDLSDVERHQMLHEVEDALSSVLAKHSIDAVLAREPGRAPPLDADAVSGNQRHILEKIGRAIFTEHPNHLKMREIFELLDIDRDGFVRNECDFFF